MFLRIGRMSILTVKNEVSPVPPSVTLIPLCPHTGTPPPHALISCRSSHAKAEQATGLTARPPTRLTSGKRRAWCQKLSGTLIPSNKRKDKKSNTNAYGRKGRERKRLYTNACGKERKNSPQMPMAKKERLNHKWWWQTKNGCPNQASKQKGAALIRQANSWHQMKERKLLKPPHKPKRWPTCKHKVEKLTIKSQVLQTTVCNKRGDEYSQSHKSTEQN